MVKNNKTNILKLVIKTLVYAFALFGIVFILVLFGVLALMGPKTQYTSVPKSTVLALDLNNSYSELRQDDLFADFTNTSVYSVFDLVRAIYLAADDKRVKALVANINQTSLGMAQIQEIANAVSYFKSRNKKTYVYSTSMGSFGQGTKEYYLATNFDEIWMQPNSDIGMTGVSIEVPFFKKVFDKVGVEPEFYARYEYKTAVSSFLEEDWSKPFKEEMQTLGGGLFEQLVDGISKNRNLKKDLVLQAVNMAPVFSQYALENALIDKIAYRLELISLLKRVYNADLIDITDYMAGITESKNDKIPQIAFMAMEGVIESGESSNNPVRDAVIGSETVLAQLDELKSKKNLKALIVRLNTPGGSYTASDEIRYALMQFKKEKNVPVIVSMGDYAASGGYFISLAGDYVFAEPATITGSIGVFGGKVVLGELWKKLSLNWGEIKFGDNAGILSINHKFSDTEREVFSRSLDMVYADFTQKVSERRGIGLKQMDLVARGRVWLGKNAVQLNLVDEIGGIESAIAKARELSGLTDSQFNLVYFPRKESFQEKLTKFFESGAGLPSVKVLAPFEELSQSAKILKRLKYDSVLPPFELKM